MSDGAEGKHALPPGWVETTLGDAGDFVAGVAFPPAKQGRSTGDLPFAKVSDLSRAVSGARGILADAANWVMRSEVKELKARVIPVGSTVFAKIGEAIRSNNRALTTRELLIDNNAMAFVPRRDVLLSEFARAYLGTQDFYQLSSATTVPSLRKSDLDDLSCPVPPLSEQRRIVAKLDDLLARSRRAKEALAEIPALLERYRQSVLAAAFRGYLTAEWRAGYPEAGTWAQVTLRALAAAGTIITYGIILPGDEVAGGVAYVRQQDIEDGYIRIDHLRRTTMEIAAKHERSTLMEGDVLLCIIRHLRVAVVPATLNGANITQGSVRIRVDRDRADPNYVALYLRSPLAQAWMKERYFGMAMPRINVADARAVPVPLASIAEQREIVRRVEAAFAKIDAVATLLDAERERLDALDRAIVTRAFRGELVPQDPNDEPASVLLDRIRQERASMPARGPRRGRALP